MATLIPIRGWRYDPRGGDLAAVITPPYDVIDAAAQREYYARHPYNIIRLEYGLTFPDDDAGNNRYTRAAATFRKWREEGVLTNEDRPAFYFYEQTFYLSGVPRTRTGFFCGLKLEPYGKNIFPHEETLPAAKADRLELLRACKANFSPIFGLYADPEGLLAAIFARRGQPVCDFTGDDGQRHRLWVVRDEPVIAAVTDFFASQRVYIADGHHRFETALQYARERRAAEKPTGVQPYDFILALLVNIYDPGLVILPTHRLVKVTPAFNLEAFLTAVAEFFTVVETRRDRVAQAAGRYVFGLYTREGRAFHLRLKEGLDPAGVLLGPGSPAWKRLEVAVLHALILERLLGIDAAECRAGTRVSYTHDATAACRLVDGGSWDMAFFLRAPEVAEMVAVAEAGERMPQKSTYFYPKVPTGLVLYAWE
ncbi:DUF1015 domain-containing protein [Thermodesulfitimonas autotrophica]|uniref:DUF1015 domain-containing protein n=1 Tax=Thermodesulfitimonas autotrophica TaxID=1894989 RepID=UPI002FE3CAEC